VEGFVAYILAKKKKKKEKNKLGGGGWEGMARGFQ